ncbi:protein fantom-like isoform X2 [Haemaphysalis longicornis]
MHHGISGVPLCHTFAATALSHNEIPCKLASTCEVPVSCVCMQKMENMSASNSSLLGEVDQLSSQLKAEQAKNLLLEEKLAACEAMQKALAELEERLADLQQENGILKTANEQLLTSIEGTDTDESQRHEEVALRSQIAQLEAIIKSDNDEKAVLEKELAERIELYRTLQEDHVNLEQAHSEVTARLERVQIDLQNLQEETHRRNLSMARVVHPEGVADDQGAVLPNGPSKPHPSSRKKCFDKEVQATLVENGYKEMAKLKEEVIEREKIHIKELQNLLEEKSKKIEVLEKHLASKQVQVTEVCAPNEADDEHCLSLVRKGQSFLELHLNKITFVSHNDACRSDPRSPVFATWTFSDFQPQSTPIATGDCPEFNCTARYAVTVDSNFIQYLQKEPVQVQIQEMQGPRVRSVGVCQIPLRPALQQPFQCCHAQAALVGIQDGQHKHFVGTLSCWVRFLPAPGPAEKFLSFSVPTSPPKGPLHSTPEHQSKRQNGEPTNGLYSGLRVNIGRCLGIPSKQGQVPKKYYCCYHFCDFPEQETGLASAASAGSVDFHHVHTFSVKVDAQLHKQLLSQSLGLLVFDEEDAEPGSFVGKASVLLSPLAMGQAVQGCFPLLSPQGEATGSVELELAWVDEYHPPKKPVPRTRSRDQLGNHKPKKMHSQRRRALDSHLATTGRSDNQQLSRRPEGHAKNEHKGTTLQKEGRSKGEPLESSSLTSVSSLSSSGAANGAPGSKRGKDHTQEDSKDATGVNKGSFAEDSQSIDEFSNGQVVVKAPSLKRSATFKISDTAVFSIINLGFLPGASVLKNKSVEMIFVEFHFLDCAPEDLETPVALPKPKPPQRIAFNFRKVIHLDTSCHEERREALASMLSSRNPNSAIIKFTVVSEPLDKDKDAECQDVGTASVDLKQILKYGKDIIEEDVDVMDTKSNKVIGKLNISIEILAALKHILAEQKRAAGVPLKSKPAVKV